MIIIFLASLDIDIQVLLRFFRLIVHEQVPRLVKGDNFHGSNDLATLS